MLLHSRAAHQSHVTAAIDSIANRLQLGDWKLLNILGCNMEPLVFGELLVEIDNLIKREENKKEEEERNFINTFVTKIPNITHV